MPFHQEPAANRHALLLTTAFLLCLARDAISADTDAPDLARKILFPSASNSRAPLAREVPICQGATYCEEVADYPIERIRQEIDNNPELTQYASVDLMSYGAQRTDDPEVDTLCLSVEKVVFPKSAEDISGEWQYVLNNENFTQGIRIEVCVQENSSCRVIDGFAQGYTTSCQQKYIYRELTAITTDGKITRNYFRFPTSCCCHVEFTGMANLLKYSGKPIKPKLTPVRANAGPDRR